MARKTPYWRTKAGKERLRQRRAEKELRNGEASPAENPHVAYIFGRTEKEIEHYARSNGISFATLANGVATLLRHSQGGEVLGTKH